MTTPLESSLAELTDVQRRAVDWNDGALLVLAGPGTGKTRTLTCRIARLLDSSESARYRILALTFTSKAATEMSQRVETLVPRATDRAAIKTFHSFCAQVLRQHGVHIGVRPDFAICARHADRRAILEDALLRTSGAGGTHDDQRLLPIIDRLLGHFVDPEAAEQYVATIDGLDLEPGLVTKAYTAYRKELRELNVFDFESLIFDAYRLFEFSAISRQYKKSYPYWLIDEFQDTNHSQYKLLRRMAGTDFRNIFAVADDDQTIFEWNGASTRRIAEFVADFESDVVHLPTNFRCAPSIVEAGNQLLVYNSERLYRKTPAVAAHDVANGANGESIRCYELASEKEEALLIANEIEKLTPEARGNVGVLARTAKMLEAVKQALSDKNVPAAILKRRDDFASPEMRWYVACLRQINRPLDHRNMISLVEAFKSFAATDLDWEELVSRAKSEDRPLLPVWLAAVGDQKLSETAGRLVRAVAAVTTNGESIRRASQAVLEVFVNAMGSGGGDEYGDLEEDVKAWREITQSIGPGMSSLDRFLQELDLRSKQAAPAAGAVQLSTIHGAKSRGFDTVFLLGMAEGILPSWHSLRQPNGKRALEEERRSCFVAITRARKRLILTRARSYWGWPKKPSRFLEEMGCCRESG